MRRSSGKRTTWRNWASGASALDATLGAIAEEAAPLTEDAWKFRYPGEPYEPESRGG